MKPGLRDADTLVDGDASHAPGLLHLADPLAQVALLLQGHLHRRLRVGGSNQPCKGETSHQCDRCDPT